MKRIAFALVSSVLFASCGVKYCVVGLGDCEEMFRGSGERQGGGGRMTVTAVNTAGQSISSLTMRETAKISIVGGVTPYFPSVTPPECGTVDGGYNFTPKQPTQECKVTIKDSSRDATTGRGLSASVILEITN